MDTFDTSEEVMSEIDIEATEIDSGENFEYGVNDQERENNNEQEAGIDGEKGEKSIEDEKLNEEKIESLGQFVIEMRGGAQEDWKLTYNEEGHKFDGKELLDQNGNSLTEIIKNSEEKDNVNADKIQNHHSMLAHFANNPDQPYMLPDWIERTEDKEIIHVTVAVADKEGNVRYETWSHEEEIKKEEEKEEKPIDKIDVAKLEEATLNLNLNIDIDKQEEVNKETLIDQSLLAEIEVNKEQEVENVQEVIQSEEGNVISYEVSQINVEPITVQGESFIDNVVSYEQFSDVDTIRNSEQVLIENVKAEKVDIDKENIIDVDKIEEMVNINVFKNVEDKTIKNVEKILTLEDRIQELLRDEDEPIEVVSEQIQTFQTENVQQEQIIIDIDKTTEINTSIENVAEEELVSSSTYNTEVSESFVNEILNTTIERSVISNEQVEQVEQISITKKIEVDMVEEKPEEVVLVNEQESKISTTTEQIGIKEVIIDTEAKDSEHVTIEQTHIEKTNIVSENNEGKENAITKTEEVILDVATNRINVNNLRSEKATTERIVENTEDKNITSQEMETSKPLVNEILGESKETLINSIQQLEKEINITESTEINSIREEVTGKAQTSDVMVETIASSVQDISKTETILSEVVYITKGKENIVIETEIKDINSKIDKIDNVKPQNINIEKIIVERKIQNEEAKTEKVVIDNKDIKVNNIKEQINTKEEISEKTQIPNIRTENEISNKQVIENMKEIVQSEENNFIVPGTNQIYVEPLIMQEENIIVEKIDVEKENISNIDKKEISKTESILTEFVDEKHVVEEKNFKSESNVAQADQNKESAVNVIKGEEKIVVETKGKYINLNTEKVDNTKSEKVTTGKITVERKTQNKEAKPEEVVLNNDKDIKLANTRENKVVTKEIISEKLQVLNIKTEKEVVNNVLSFKTGESKVNSKNVEVKSTKPVVVEKVDISKEVNRLTNTNKEKAVAKNQEERTPKSSREAIVLSINRNTINNTIKSEASISLEKPIEEKRTTDESLKAKSLDGHEILLQILGISQNATELRNAGPVNSRSVPNTNQEELENNSIELIPSIYQRSNLNGITLKIAA